MSLLSPLRSLAPQNPTSPFIVRIVGVVYASYFFAALAGIVLMLSNETEQWVVDFSAWVIFVTSALHFGFTASGYLLYEDYEHAPVDPVWLFLFADYFQAGALGAAIASYAMDPSSRVALYVASAVTMTAQLACLYKTMSLLSNPAAAR